MVSSGETAPRFAAKYGTSDHEDFDLGELLGEKPLVLAFFPAAFTPPCSSEMVAFQERLDDIRDAGAEVLGVSADSPFTLGRFREEYDIEFDLVSDNSRAAIEEYGLKMDLPGLGLYGVANRAVYVVDGDGEVTYSWVADDPTNEPDYDEVLEALRSL